ncbi:hypothetical protein HYC85_003598 [Camellia sinensis]|uniref:Uncharacterized protein n=1 Tax=Camellia sinensis TaxID=4442 RepID=A0A7J7HU50_CAMSI|nr:hypothetical protein HYC85_003598 [Camellia sinensis]
MYLDYDGNTLLWFMTIDGLFLLEFLQTCISKKDRLSSSWSRKPNLFESEGSKFASHSILRDVVMLENQIPIFLLGNIFDFLDIDKNELLSMVTNANPTRIVPFREVCDANAFKITTSLIMTGIELPDQLAGVQGAVPLGESGAAPRRGRGAAPPKQNAKMHSKLPVRSSGHFPARAENSWFQQFWSPVKSIHQRFCLFYKRESCSSVDSEEFEPEASVDSGLAHHKDNSEIFHDHLLKLLYDWIVMNVKVPKEASPTNMPSGTPCPEEEIHLKVDSGSQVLCLLLKLSSNLNIPLVGKITKPINMIVNLPWATAKSLPEMSRMATNLNEGLKFECDVLGEDITNPIVEEIMIPSMSTLCNVGVSIKFDKKKKKFYLPHLKLNVNSKVITRNLVAFEASISDFLVLGRYTELMNGIIDTAEDAKLLKKKGIIEYSLKTDAEVAQLFNGITRSIRPSKVPYIDIAIEDVNKYDFGTRKVKILTLLATVLVVLLMGMQSFCSVYSCPRFFNVSNDLGK